MEDQKSSNDKEVIDLLIATTVPIALQNLANKIAGTVPAARMQKAAVKGWSMSRTIYPTTIRGANFGHRLTSVWTSDLQRQIALCAIFNSQSHPALSWKLNFIFCMAFLSPSWKDSRNQGYMKAFLYLSPGTWRKPFISRNERKNSNLIFFSSCFMCFSVWNIWLKNNLILL